jgi:hypothetical protein
MKRTNSAWTIRAMVADEIRAVREGDRDGQDQERHCGPQRDGGTVSLTNVRE